MRARLGAAKLVELCTGFFDTDGQAFGLRVLGGQQALGSELHAFIQRGGDAGLEKEFDDAGDERLLARLHGGGLDEVTVVEKQVFLDGQRFERSEKSADRLRGGFHGGRLKEACGGGDRVRFRRADRVLGDAAGLVHAAGFLSAEHFGPAVAEFADEFFDLDDRFDFLAHVGLEEAAQVVVV